MTKLYRGVKETPRFAVKKVQERLKELEAEVSRKAHLPIAEQFRLLGPQIQELYELRQIVGPNFFTDDEKIARRFAGKDGHVVIIDVPDELAKERFTGMEMMSPGEGENVMVNNFVFNGTDLIENMEPWRVQHINLKEEREGKVVKEEPIKGVDSPFHRVIDNEAGLAPRDSDALADIRSRLSDLGLGGSPEAS